MEVGRHNINLPLEILTTSLGIPKEYKQQCIDEIYERGHSNKALTNVKAIRSSYQIWTETTTLNPLLDKIIEKTNLLIPILDTRYKYKLDSAWTALYKEGHYTKQHIHTPSIISFVYYLKSNIDSSPLVFGNNNHSIPSSEDLLILFPSSIPHRVPPNYGGDRICVAGNFNWEFIS